MNVALLGTSHGLKFQHYFLRQGLEIPCHNYSQSEWLDGFNSGSLCLSENTLEFKDFSIDLNTLDGLIIVDLGFQYRMLETYLIEKGYLPEDLFLKFDFSSSVIPISNEYARIFAAHCSGVSSRVNEKALTGLGALIRTLSSSVPIILVPAYLPGHIYSNNDKLNTTKLYRSHVNQFLHSQYSKVLKGIFAGNSVEVIYQNKDWLNDDLSMPSKYWAEDIENQWGKMSHQNDLFVELIWPKIASLITKFFDD